MRRLARWALNAVTVLSLGLCVGTAGLWMRSQWTFTRVWYTRPLLGPDATRQRRFAAILWRDRIGVSMETELFHPEDAAAGERLRRDLPGQQRVQVYEQRGVSTLEDGLPDLSVHRGFYYRSPEVSRQVVLPQEPVYVIGGGEYPATSESWRSLFMPWWFPVLAFACWPAIVIGRWMRSWSRRRAGRCLRCNYNLAGNVSGVCPECGTQILKSGADLSN